MVTLLSKLLIKNYRSYTEPKVRESYGILCGGVGIFLNLILFACKLLAGSLSGSIAIIADALNNLSDAGSSIITLIGFRLAGKKPDRDHPYGHGRMEYLSGVFVSIAILIMAFELIKSSFDKIIHPQEVSSDLVVLIILLLSILVKLYMNIYNRSIAKKINSAAMKATATDSLSDTIATTVVLISTLITKFFHIQIDGYCGVLVGLFIAYSGVCALKDTMAPLLGQSPSLEFVQHIEDIVMSHSAILGMHDLIVHDYGPGRVMISLHAEVPANGDMMELHDLIDNIEKDLRNELRCDATIHMDPIQNEDETTLQLKTFVLYIIHSLNPQISLHDFRIVVGPTHTNLIFDIVVPFDYKLSANDIITYLNTHVQEQHPNYFCVIAVDTDYANRMSQK